MQNIDINCSSFEAADKIKDFVDNSLNKLIDDCILKNQINKGNNKELSSVYYGNKKNIQKQNKQINFLKIIRWFAIFMLIFPFFLINNSIKKKKLYVEQLNKDNNSLENKLSSQLSPLINFFSYSNIEKFILNNLSPNFHFQKNINLNNCQYFEQLYKKNSKSNITFDNGYFGQFFNYPFTLIKKKIQDWKQQVYTGTATIPYRDSNGNWQTEIIMATVTWKAPFWLKDDYLIIYADYPNKLNFDNLNSLKNVNKIKKFYKKNDQQSPMENKEFDALFPCLRSDEQKFRVLFSLLTQEKIVSLYKKIEFNIKKEEEYFYVGSNFIKNKKKYDIDVDYQINGYSNLNYDIDTFCSNLKLKITNFLTDFFYMQLPLSNMPNLINNYCNNPNSTDSDYLDGWKLQLEIYANNLFDKIKNKFNVKTDGIVKLDKFKKYIVKNNITCWICEATIHHFNPIEKIIPTMGYGSHGSKMINVKVIDYKEETTKFYFVFTKANLWKNEAIISLSDNYFMTSNKEINENKIDKWLA